MNEEFYAPRTPFWLWPLSGVIFGVAFLSPLLWWLFIPAIALWLAALQRSHALLQSVWGSWIVGTGKAAGAIVWFWHTYPIEWAYIGSDQLQLVLIGVYWIVTSVAIGAGMTVAGVLFHVLRNTHWWPLVFPLLLVMSEVIGSLLFSLYSLGPGAVPNIHFSFGYTGYLLADMAPLNAIALFGGVYSLSFTAALIGGAVYLVSINPRKYYRSHVITYRVKFGLVALLMLALGGMYQIHSELRREPIRILAVVTAFPSVSYTAGSSVLQDQTETVRELVFRALSYDTDIILLPEDARFTTLFVNPDVALAALKRSDSSAIVIDSSRWKNHNDETVMRAFYYNLARDSVHTVDKRYLVPQGEFVPYMVTMLARVFGMQTYIEAIARDQSYRAVSYKDVVGTEAYPAILFCSESVSPLLVRKIARAGKDSVMLHPVSHARFHGSSLLARQLDAMLRVQALANGITIVSSGNMTGSKVYYKDGSIGTGKVVEETPHFKLVEYIINSK